MNLDELQSVQSRERQTDSLQQLRASFYQDAAEFIQTLRRERDEAAERADDPFDSPDVNRLSDDIRTAEQTVEAIYERRVGKVVKMASLAAADMPTEQEGLTEEEQALFETMVEAIEDHREAILTVLGGGSPAGTVSATPTDRDEPHVGADERDENGLDAAAVMGEGDDESDDEPPETDRPPGTPGRSPGDEADAGDRPGAAPDGTGGTDSSGGSDASHHSEEAGGSAADQTGASTSDDGGNAGDDDGSAGDDDGSAGDDDGSACDVEGEGEADSAIDTDRVTVRITEDVGEIFGVDEREYDLAADDVVTLPVTNAKPLIDRDAAEPLE